MPRDTDPISDADLDWDKEFNAVWLNSRHHAEDGRPL
jgi:hypothetical protein